MMAVQRHQTNDYIQKIIDEGGDLSSQENFFGNTPLIWAIADANYGTAQILIRAGGETDRGSLAIQCKRGNSALHLAVAKGYKQRSIDWQELACSSLDLINELIAYGSPVDLQNSDGNTPLHLACLRRDPQMIDSLLKAGANRAIRNKNGKTPEELLDFDYKSSWESLYQTCAVFSLVEQEHTQRLKEAREAFSNPSIQAV